MYWYLFAVLLWCVLIDDALSACFSLIFVGVVVAVVRFLLMPFSHARLHAASDSQEDKQAKCGQTGGGEAYTRYSDREKLKHHVNGRDGV